MNSQINAFLASYSREAREIALCLRKLVLDVISNANEKIDSETGTIIYFGQNTQKSCVCAIAPHMKHVNLIFSKGALLPDPSKLLCGKGEQARHVKFRSEAETENSALQLLLKEALKLDHNDS